MAGGKVQIRISFSQGSGVSPPRDITDARAGETDARVANDDLMLQVYDQLRDLAGWLMSRERPGQTLQTTALVHEAYLRLSRANPARWWDRGAFYLAAAQAMRRILLDRARAKQTAKRGGRRPVRVVQEGDLVQEPVSEGILDLDDALSRLLEMDPRAGHVVMLRYFVGLNMDETAEVLGVSRSSVKREWNFAKSWLARALQEPDDPS
jgi:RNA polymerase sigma factor (TIGR02999 family)